MALPASFYELYCPLPRQGPGLPEETRAALDLCRPWLPPQPDVLDLGCGSGASTAVLAAELDARILAVDVDEGLLARCRQATRGSRSLVATRQADMAAPTLAEGRFDLCWSEGAIYIIGFEEGLRRWRFLLRPGGCVAVSHLTWLVPDPPAEIAAYMAAELPDMADAATNVQRMEDAGYVVLGTRTLPARAWWQDYFGPLEARIDLLAPRWAGQPEAEATLEEARRELDMYRRFGDSYGYVFYVGRRT